MGMDRFWCVIYFRFFVWTCRLINKRRINHSYFNKKCLTFRGKHFLLFSFQNYYTLPHSSLYPTFKQGNSHFHTSILQSLQSFLLSFRKIYHKKPTLQLQSSHNYLNINIKPNSKFYQQKQHITFNTKIINYLPNFANFASPYL